MCNDQDSPWFDEKIILPLLTYYELITEFEIKVNIFNLYFVNQCIAINNNYTFPSILN